MEQQATVAPQNIKDLLDHEPKDLPGDFPRSRKKTKVIHTGRTTKKA